MPRQEPTILVLLVHEAPPRNALCRKGDEPCGIDTEHCLVSVLELVQDTSLPKYEAM